MWVKFYFRLSFLTLLFPRIFSRHHNLFVIYGFCLNVKFIICGQFTLSFLGGGKFSPSTNIRFMGLKIKIFFNFNSPQIFNVKKIISSVDRTIEALSILHLHLLKVCEYFCLFCWTQSPKKIIQQQSTDPIYIFLLFTVKISNSFHLFNARELTLICLAFRDEQFPQICTINFEWIRYFQLSKTSLIFAPVYDVFNVEQYLNIQQIYTTVKTAAAMTSSAL